MACDPAGMPHETRATAEFFPRRRAADGSRRLSETPPPAEPGGALTLRVEGPLDRHTVSRWHRELGPRLKRAGAGVVRLDLGAPAAAEVLEVLTSQRPVHQAVATERGAVVRLANRTDVPAVVAACVNAGASVFGVDPREPNLEDVYFALEAQAAEGGA